MEQSERGFFVRGQRCTLGLSRRAVAMKDRDRARLRIAFPEREEPEAFAQMLYSAFGGFVEWEALPPDSRSKEEYRQKARDLLKFVEVHRRHHGKVTVPLEPTPEMLAADYRAILAARASGQPSALVALAPKQSARPCDGKPDTTGPAARVAALGYPPDLG